MRGSQGPSFRGGRERAHPCRKHASRGGEEKTRIWGLAGGKNEPRSGNIFAAILAFGQPVKRAFARRGHGEAQTAAVGAWHARRSRKAVAGGDRCTITGSIRQVRAISCTGTSASAATACRGQGTDRRVLTWNRCFLRFPTRKRTRPCASHGVHRARIAISMRPSGK